MLPISSSYTCYPLNMKIFSLLFLIILVIAVKEVDPRTTDVDLVLEALNDQEWRQEEQSCFKQTVFILNNAKNYTVWAMWVWNSMQYPVGTFYGAPFNLGHYDQCLDAPTKAVNVTTQYCLADVKLTNKIHKWENRNAMGNAESFLGTKNHMNRDVSKITWGVCLPVECNPRSAAKILKAIYIVNPLMPVEPHVEIGHCQIAGVKNDFTVGFYAFVLLVGALVATSLLSTIYGHHLNPNLSTTQVLRCFCLKRNWDSLTQEPSSDVITSMNLIKAVIATVAVIIHTHHFRITGPIANVFYIDWVISVNDREIFLKNVAKNFVTGLEVFFAIAGLLLIKGLMTSKKHPLTSLVSRYFRLIGTLALVNFYVAVVAIHTGDGPLWQKLAGREQKASLDNWPWALLMLNNFVNSENITQIVAWHIPCDYQLAIMGTLIFMLWRKNYRLGKTVTILVFVAATLIPVVVSYWMNLPENVILDDIGKIADLRSNEVYLELHIKSYHRAVAYIIGMGMGYIMAVYKPEKHRKCISLKLSLLLFVAVSITIFRVLTTAQYNKNDRLATGIKISYDKIATGLATCAFIGLIEYGSIPFLRAATKFRTITVLSRLTYGMYLLHTLFLQQNSYSRRYNQQIEIFTEVTYGIGIVFWTILASVFLWLLVEAPLNNLVNYFTTPRDIQNKEEEDDTQALTLSEDTFDDIVRAKEEKIKCI